MLKSSIWAVVCAAAIFLAAIVEYGPNWVEPESQVVGVWKGVHVERTGPDTSWTADITQPEVLIFTDNHWGAVRITGGEPRPMLDDNSTDEQRLAALRRVRMSAGSYEVDGSSMTTKTISHWNPNAEAEARTNTSGLKFKGDAMVRTFKNDETGVKWVVTYERRAETPASQIDGVWQDVMVDYTSPDTSWTREIVRPAIVIYSRGHYVVSRVSGQQERELWPEDGPDDALRLKSMSRLRAAGGTFIAADGKITSTPIVHWNPNTMASGDSVTAAYELSDGSLWRTFRNEETGEQWKVKSTRRTVARGQ